MIDDMKTEMSEMYIAPDVNDGAMTASTVHVLYSPALADSICLYAVLID